MPVKEGGFVEGTIEAAEGDKVTVKVGKDERKILKKDQVMGHSYEDLICVLTIHSAHRSSKSTPLSSRDART